MSCNCKAAAAEELIEGARKGSTQGIAVRGIMKDRERKLQVQEPEGPAIEIIDVVKVYKLYDREIGRAHV